MLPAHFSRRRFLAGLGATAAGLGVAACSGPAGSAPVAAATVTVDTLKGPVVVPAAPQRIVAVSFPEAMALLDVGITPVGRPTYLPPLPAYAEAMKLPTIDEAASPVVERVAALKPDLIIGSDFAPDSSVAAQRTMPYEQLSKLAPTLLFEWKAAAGNWPVEATQTAAAVGRSAQMDALASRMHERAAAIRSTHADVLSRTTWDLISWQPGNDWFVYSPESSHGKVLAEAGVRFGAAAGQTDNFKAWSLERFDVLARTDGVIVQMVNGANPLPGQAAYDALPLVKAGHAYDTTWFFPAGYQAAMLLLDDLDKALTAYSA
ncbi:MAG: hypothetical protein ABS81_29065 [Pseudonocardia sp. SCN 72-86]|nr:MAG: hypothetical protein ABS81_29065 [Pseudonocardia sp. SCN 72-86]